MAIYFFDWWEDNILVPEPTGIDLPDLSAAEREARRGLLEAALDRPAQWSHLTLVIRDEAGHIVRKLTLAWRDDGMPTGHLH